MADTQHDHSDTPLSASRLAEIEQQYRGLSWGPFASPWPTIHELITEVRRLQRERETASREYRTLKLAVCLDERAVCERVRDRYFELLDDPERVDAEYQRVAVLQEFGFLPTPEGARDA